MPKTCQNHRSVQGTLTFSGKKTFLGFCQVNFIVFSPYPCAPNGAGIHGGCGIDNDYLFSGTSIENICFWHVFKWLLPIKTYASCKWSFWHGKPTIRGCLSAKEEQRFHRDDFKRSLHQWWRALTHLGYCHGTLAHWPHWPSSILIVSTLWTTLSSRICNVGGWKTNQANKYEHRH